MIHLEGLAAAAGPFQLRDVSLDVPEGGYGLVIGPTGSGKTTLLEAIAGHAPVLGGSVHLGGRDVTALAPECRGVGMVYQQYQLFPHMTVAGNIGYGLARMPSEEARARVQMLAEMLGIGMLLERGTERLSGGEQQRVAIARALAPRPRVLLLDEPFAALDPSTRTALRRELRGLHEREGTTTLQVTHDFDEALRLGDRVVVLAEGRVVQAGTPETVFRRPSTAFVARFIGSGNVIAGTVEFRTAPGAPGELVPARFRATGLELDVLAEREGAMHAVIRPEDLTLSREEHASSARNHFGARIEALERVGPLTYVHLDAGHPIVALLTSDSATGMALAAGREVRVAIKATAILLI